WKFINETLSKELGLFNLTDERFREPNEHCHDFLLSCTHEQAIDIIELSLVVLNVAASNYSNYEREKYKITQSAESAIKEINYWFKDNNVGYEFTNGEIIRIDQTHMHEEVVKPAITLLFEEDFQGAAEEFLKAHSHYRKGDYKNALVEALKSFESTMKTICDKKGYTYNKGSDTAQKLITILFDNNLIPEYLRNHFSGLRNTLEAGLPTVRNKQAGHGQGTESIKVEPYFVEYAINLAATNIVFLIKAYKES
ncbi:STM4504/CBY_0614 family protein, partial [Bacillus sp. FSL R10-2780]|uniref:STM4504/CBY_0614 family protein n=1 Tax=Bacillus sp. FSL R10-2780 TaxID=2954660 RepID=UPI0030F70057